MSPRGDPLPDLMTIPQFVAQRPEFGLSERTAYRAARRHELPGACTLNGRTYLRTRVTLRWLDGELEGSGEGGDHDAG